ncbi:cation transporter [Echinicola pacifica]|uniref:Cation transporter n=1 Tax=Echinicola pacifica TaxID=346377 RepID=A0A918UU81_9BACT|nr:efflux RND transporter periplasmic adaptor subunit [Echinicola pacifica]GGZ34280.1 cation transporter [Echinicola pacifica]
MRTLFLGLLTVLLCISCGEKEEGQEEVSLESIRGEVSATAVTIAKAEKRSFDFLINASGKIEASQQVMVIIETSGYLVDLPLKEGQYVSSGAIIASLDQTNSRFRHEKALVQLKMAEVAYESDKLGFSSLLQGEDTEKIKLIDEQLRASSGLLSAAIEVKEAQIELDKASIKAPISGKVADLKIKAGSLVNAGDELCELLSTDALELHVKVLESDIPFISLGQQTEVYPVSSGTVPVSGQVYSINPKVDEHGLVEVGIKLGKSQHLLPGMNARAVIRAPQSDNVVVPKQALVYRSGRAVVFTIQAGEAKWNYVEVGKDNGREVEILEGISDAEDVITSNNLQLAHQAPVKIVEENN